MHLRNLDGLEVGGGVWLWDRVGVTSRGLAADQAAAVAPGPARGQMSPAAPRGLGDTGGISTCPTQPVRHL